MQLRTFIASDMRAAMVEIRRQMGPDAIIVSSQKAKSGGVMVRVALETESEMVEPAAQTMMSEEPAAVLPFESRYRNTLLARLRQGPRTIAHAPEPAKYDRAQLLAAFRRHRLPQSLAHGLAQRAEELGLTDMGLALAAAIGKSMHSDPLDLSAAKAILLTGPYGGGKSAVAAKLAASAQAQGRKVTLIGADTTGAGAIARLECFATHLGATCEAAEGVDALSRSLANALASRHLAIIDTASFDPRNAKARNAFLALGVLDGIETVGVVSALSDAEELGEIVRTIATGRLIVTGLDLAKRAGAMMTAALSGPSIAHVTRSPFAGGGLDTVTPFSLARMIVEPTEGDAS